MLSYKVKCAILVFGELYAVGKESHGLKASELKVKLGFPRGLQQLLVALKNKGLLSHDAYRGWYGIQADPEKLTLWELISIVDDDDEEQHYWPAAGEDFPVAVSFDTTMRNDFKAKTSKVTVADLVRKRKKK